MLWPTQDLVEATGGRPIGRLPEGVGGISIDTRTLNAGDAFFAIKGDRFDGHDFATAAMAAGAGLIVVAEERLPALGRLAMPMIVVPDVLAALGAVGHAARLRSRARVIAITGSAGKTSTKEMLRQSLAASGTVHAADRSFNNHWGVPLTMARLPADCDYAIIEIGMNHPGEIRPLTMLVRPHIAVVTLVAAAHLGHFNSVEEIARAKAEIFEGVEEDGFALINRDDRHWKTLSGLAAAAGIKNVWGFGEHSRAQVKLLKCSLNADNSTINVKMAGHEMIAKVGAPGRHMVQNALAVIGAVHLAGADVAKALIALAGIVPERGRGRRHELRHPDGAITLIDESYNANPASMKAAIQLLDTVPVSGKGRRIAVLGDMLELGGHSARLHAGLADIIAETNTDIVFLAGAEMKALAERLPVEFHAEYRPTVEELQTVLLNAVKPGDAIMVKSSNGVGFSRLVDALVKRFPAAADRSRRA